MLIILAGVSISLVLGDNGIVTKAKDAKQNMQIAANEEQEGLANLEVAIQEGTNGGTTPPGGSTAVVGQIVTGSNKPYTNNGTAIIPVGFAIVPELDDVSEGLVISLCPFKLSIKCCFIYWYPYKLIPCICCIICYI